MIGKIYRPKIKVNNKRGICIYGNLITYNNRNENIKIEIDMIYDIENISEYIEIKYKSNLPLYLNDNYYKINEFIAKEKKWCNKKNNYVKFRKILKPIGTDNGYLTSINKKLCFYLKISDKIKSMVDDLNIQFKVDKVNNIDCLRIYTQSVIPIKIISDNLLI